MESFYDESNPSIEIKTWKYYSENGKLIKKETYDKGILIKIKEI